MRDTNAEVSFEDFVRARSSSLLRTALLLVGQHRAEAEDLLQFALVNLSSMSQRSGTCLSCRQSRQERTDPGGAGLDERLSRKTAQW